MRSSHGGTSEVSRWFAHQMRGRSVLLAGWAIVITVALFITNLLLRGSKYHPWPGETQQTLLITGGRKQIPLHPCPPPPPPPPPGFHSSNPRPLSITPRFPLPPCQAPMAPSTTLGSYPRAKRRGTATWTGPQNGLNPGMCHEGNTVPRSPDSSS